ncbi:MAG: immunity 53 family protein [Flavobacteriaceae bacterium]|jgi:hypothetical protein|nr:immunity 53 family protein [Flavobacteriaceae bacterium]
MEIIKWIEDWFASHCDGDWEHSYGIKIKTIDNPGWHIEIDLEDTPLENLSIDYSLTEFSETDWYGYSVKDGKFKASGDITKLSYLLEIFRNMVMFQS